MTSEILLVNTAHYAGGQPHCCSVADHVQRGSVSTVLTATG